MLFVRFTPFYFRDQCNDAVLCETVALKIELICVYKSLTH